MSSQQAQHTMNAYFAKMSTGDFARCYTSTVTWTTVESGEVISTPLTVQNAIIGLHARLTDFQTRRLVVTDDSAYLEGSAVRIDGPSDRVGYCIAYDLDGDLIAAMRAYGALATSMPAIE